MIRHLKTVRKAADPRGKHLLHVSILQCTFSIPPNLRTVHGRVLIFSQMVRVLDIISDYMRRRGYAHQRLDGSTPAGVRHQVRTNWYY